MDTAAGSVQIVDGTREKDPGESMIPQTKEEFERLFHQNQNITGFGIETTMHMPCPFCAAADWNVFRVIDSQEALAKRSHCSTCKRTVQGNIVRTPNEVSFGMTLVEGDDPPSWSPMQRADA